MMLDLDKIEAAAKAATLWDCQEHADEHWYECDEPGPHTVEIPWSEVLECELIDDCQPQTAEYLHACSPAVVLAIVAELRDLRQLKRDHEDYKL
jgi:hypothetical protein